MEPPTSLPARLYLIAYDLERGRLTGRTYLDMALRAAALEDLRRAGHLVEDAGKVRVAKPANLADPILNGLLREITDGKPRNWTFWVAARNRRMQRAVREQLDDRLYIRIEQRRFLGIFPWTTVIARDTSVIRHLQDGVRRALTDGRPVPQIEPDLAALVAFAAIANLLAALPRPLRRAHKRRLGEFTTHVGPVAIALRDSIRRQQAAAATG